MAESPPEELQTGVSNVRNVGRYIFRSGGLGSLGDILKAQPDLPSRPVIFVVDEFFQSERGLVKGLPVRSNDSVRFISTHEEPTTEYINRLYADINEKIVNVQGPPCAIVGIGGGITLDTAKALANLLGNGGRAEDYQGWDLVKMPGTFKIGIPTISGTGAEATRTCVMTSKATGLKLGMNSDFTLFDQLILDPELTSTVPRNQYFFTGMDAYIHCIEGLSGSYRNPIGDALSEKCISLCRQVFMSEDMKSERNRADLMVASYLGGCAIASSYVGIVHPFSAGLSVVLGLHHGVANCIALHSLQDFYPEAHDEFVEMVDRQKIDIPRDVCADLSDEEFDQLYDSTIIHEKPLINALGAGFREVLTRDRVREIFARM
jgi:3-deoxy-alpha-D-manno-octulosonate 8-oxidase